MARRPDLMIIKKERTCHLVELAIPEDHRMKIKESEKRDLDLARKLRKLWNMMGGSDTNCNWCIQNYPIGLERGLEEFEIRGWIETLLSTALLELAKIPRRVWETWEDLFLLRLLWKTISWWEKILRSIGIILWVFHTNINGWIWSNSII